MMYIGGAAHGDEIEQIGSARTAQVSFKCQGDFLSDALRIHTYEKKLFTARRPNGEIVEIEFYVLDGLPDDAVKALVRARTLLEIRH